MFIDLAKELIELLRDELDAIILNESDTSERYLKTSSCFNRTFQKLSTLVVEHPFSDEQQEIYFFKYIMPKFYGLKTFEAQICKLEMNKPFGTIEIINSYWTKRLERINLFFSRNQFYYQSYRFDTKDLDNIYFLRSSKLPVLLLPEWSGPIENLQTPLGSLYARFAAFEMLQKYILQNLTNRSEAHVVDPSIQANQPSGLKWTGDAINLVELAYGIWLTRQVNNGDASISAIIRWMEKAFNIHIGRPHRRWSEISQRYETTKYLDRMKSEIEIRRQNEDDLSRQRRKEQRSRN